MTALALRLRQHGEATNSYLLIIRPLSVSLPCRVQILNFQLLYMFEFLPFHSGVWGAAALGAWCTLLRDSLLVLS